MIIAQTMCIGSWAVEDAEFDMMQADTFNFEPTCSSGITASLTILAQSKETHQVNHAVPI